MYMYYTGKMFWFQPGIRFKVHGIQKYTFEKVYF